MQPSRSGARNERYAKQAKQYERFKRNRHGWPRRSDGGRAR